MAGWQALERGAHLGALGPAQDELAWIELVGRAGQVAGDVFDRGRGPRPAAAGPQHVQTDVGGDAGDPGPELVAAVETGQALVDAQKGLLAGLGGVVGVAEHA